jgi:hypothetical protein
MLWVGDSFSGVKGPGYEAGHLLHLGFIISSLSFELWLLAFVLYYIWSTHCECLPDELKKQWGYTCIASYVFMM